MRKSNAIKLIQTREQISKHYSFFFFKNYAFKFRNNKIILYNICVFTYWQTRIFSWVIHRYMYAERYKYNVDLFKCILYIKEIHRIKQIFGLIWRCYGVLYFFFCSHVFLYLRVLNKAQHKQNNSLAFWHNIDKTNREP